MTVLFSFLLFLAQQSIDSATLSGLVADSSAARLPNAAITATYLERNQVFAETADDQGRFRFASLPVGTYRIRATADGFAASERMLTLSIGQAVEVSFALNVGGITTAVDVVENPVAVETTRTQIADTLVTAEIDKLPLNGRNYLDLALLVPGVSRTNTGNNERFAETSAVPGTGISVAGQRNLGNSFIVDGLSANDDAADLAGAFFSPEVIRELQVVKSGGIAEFGRASSGVINMVTQSGTNDWHGKLYGFLRNQRFDARNAFAASKTPLTQAQYGASLSGPIQRDRAFFFGNFEREDLNRSGLITISPANVETINAYLSQVNYPTRIETGAFPTGDNRTNVFTRTDFNPTDKTRLALRYTFYDIVSPNARNVSGLNSVTRGTIVKDRDQAIALNAVSDLRGSLNEARFQFTRSHFAAPGNDLVGPAVNVAGVANFGASTSSPIGRDIDLLEAANNYSIQHAEHAFKSGIDLIYNRVNIVFPATLYGTYSFSTLSNLLTGAYTTFGQAFGKTDWFQNNPNLGWFVQDEWQASQNVTINAGLRHDIQWLADGIHTNLRNFGPRIGLAYSPTGKRTVIRAGFGLYDDRIPLRAVANALRGDGTQYKAVSLQRTQVGAPVFPNKLASFPSGALINLATVDSRIKSPYSLQGNLQLEHQVRDGVFVSAGYLYVRGIHIIMQRNTNTPTLTAAVDPFNLGRPNSNYANITEYSGQGDSYYNGMTLSIEHRGSQHGTVRLSYTLSKAVDDTGNAFFSSPQNNFDIRDDRALSDNDQRHRLTASGEWVVTRTLRLSPIFTYSTGYPFNVLTGGQTIQTTAARPFGVGRNTGVGFNSMSLDIRLSQRLNLSERIKTDVIVESFNTLNRTNLQFPNNTYGTGATPLASFGRATNAGDPRQLQIGLKLSF